MTSGDGERPYSDDRRLVQCEHCGVWMITIEGLRRVCRDCNDRLNRGVSLKAELDSWERKKAFWAEQEREMWRNKEVG